MPMVSGSGLEAFALMEKLDSKPSRMVFLCLDRTG